MVEPKKLLCSYFKDGIDGNPTLKIGIEIETHFVDECANPISFKTSQAMFRNLTMNGWKVAAYKNESITELQTQDGDRLLYELGWQNIELACAPRDPKHAIAKAYRLLEELYVAAKQAGAYPYHAPILFGERSLLAIPDERDATWLALDGKEALKPLARIASVQFTFPVTPQQAPKLLSALGEHVPAWLAGFPQDAYWRRYIRDSHAQYRPDRYGGPLFFESMDEYVAQLIKHYPVQKNKLVPWELASEVDPALFVRSVWWHFRLKRYGNTLCIECRIFARHTDEHIALQLESVRSVVGF